MRLVDGNDNRPSWGEARGQCAPEVTPWHKKLLHKATFTFSVVCTLTIAIFTGGHPWLMPYLYTGMFPFFVGFRIKDYLFTENQFFLLDFCYVCNFALILYLWAFPHNPYFMVVLFTLAHGVLAWAVILFRNALVFHSFDKMVSVFIHVPPMLVTYCLRWYTARPFTADASRYRVWTVCEWDAPAQCDWTSWDQLCQCSSPLWVLGAPMAAYFAWALLYIVFICIFPPKRRGCDTPYSYLTAKGLAKRVKSRLDKPCNGWLSPIAYATTNVVLTFAFSVPAYLFMYSFAANTVYVCLVCFLCIWHGGTFYIEVFAKHYTNEVEGISSPVSPRSSPSSASVAPDPPAPAGSPPDLRGSKKEAKEASYLAASTTASHGGYHPPIGTPPPPPPADVP